MAHEYKMLRCRDEIYLSKEVTKHLADEWELWGNPFMISMDMENGWFCQAVVRFEPSSATHVAETAEGVLMTPRRAGHSVVGKVETAMHEPGSATHVADTADGGLEPPRPAGFSVQVPETPGQEFDYKPVAQITRSFMGRFCACEKRDGDNLECLVHHPVKPVGPKFEGVPCGCFEIPGDNPNCAVHSGGPIKSGRVY